METLRFWLSIATIVLSLLLVVFVLLHRGKGGGLSSLFGGGVQSSLSGSSVVEKNLDRVTIFVGICGPSALSVSRWQSNCSSFSRYRNGYVAAMSQPPILR